ncbi:Gfo/Idh/MocA family oxidoreductase [Phytohabitans flavus]|uniref:Oxidoreductase n=1 Tax=Phytohabitans flavus TaxID=1076124 RepID=A0A6F8Y402_9ACTN|nr:Gfo/Idh/MocA family oxidoreductase [Phytohabitans flavus]BCB80842.1 oxidoreductase [Phytohabitans flavus]
MSAVNVALVGAGRIARVHANAYRHVSRGGLVACIDPNEEAAAALARDFDLKVAPDFDALLSDDSVHALLIASPNALHADQTVAALAAGKHVFCQKPIALTLADADRVVAAAGKTDRVLQHGFMLRFTPPLSQLRDRVAGGELGEMIASRAAVFGWEPTNDWFYDPAQGGGVILDTLVHFADLVLWLFGPAQSVHTEGGAYVLEGAKRHNSPDNATVTVRHASGVVTSMYVTWTAGHGNFTFEVYGSGGSAAVDLVQAQAMRTFDRGGAGWGYPDLVWDYGYRGEQQYFVDRVAGRETGERAATAAQARDALALVLAAQRALDERRAVEL